MAHQIKTKTIDLQTTKGSAAMDTNNLANNGIIPLPGSNIDTDAPTQQSAKLKTLSRAALDGNLEKYSTNLSTTSFG